jgi:hypothetical protein
MNEVESALRQLWPSVTDDALHALLPHDLGSLRDFYPRLQQYVGAAPRTLEGTIDPAAIVRGDIIALDCSVCDLVEVFDAKHRKPQSRR